MIEGLSLLMVVALLILGALAILMPLFVYFIHDSTKQILSQAEIVNDNMERLIFITGPRPEAANIDGQPPTISTTLSSPITRLPDDPDNLTREHTDSATVSSTLTSSQKTAARDFLIVAGVLLVLAIIIKFTAG